MNELLIFEQLVRSLFVQWFNPIPFNEAIKGTRYLKRREMVNDEKTIYLVDDDDDDRMIIGQAVHQLMDQVSIIEFSSGIEFLDTVLGQQPLGKTLVLMDINMPRMSGLEVIRAMQSDPSGKQLPVLAISAATDPLLIENLIASGASGYFAKPATFEQVEQLASDIKDFYVSHYSPK